MSPSADVRLVAGDLDVLATLVAVLPPDAAADALWLGAAPDDLAEAAGRLGLRQVDVIDGLLAADPAEVIGAALAPFLLDSRVVVLDSSQSARDLAGWCTATLATPVVWAVDAVHLDHDSAAVDRVVLGGDYRLEHEADVSDRPLVVLAKPTSRSAPRSVTAPPRVIHHALDFLPRRVSVTADADQTAAGPGLASARIVVAVGRGIGGPEHLPLFQALSERLGAALGASRVVVDSGWLPFSHQVGQTGMAVSPDLYLAFGISGAVQHLAGMRGSARIVAINTDPDAAICRVADVVINGDAVEVAAGLLDRLQRAPVSASP